MKWLCTLLLFAAPLAHAGEVELGVLVPDGSRKVAEQRYRSASDWKYTNKYYDRAYPKSVFPRKVIINQPGIKAFHIINPSGKRRWEGLNIYETNGEVRIAIVAAEKDGKKTSTKSKTK